MRAGLPLLFCYTNPTPEDAQVAVHSASSVWGLFTLSILYQKDTLHIYVLMLCLFLVESKTQITQFLIHLNLTLKLYPFLWRCTDTTHFICMVLLSTWPKIPVYINLTSPHQWLKYRICKKSSRIKIAANTANWVSLPQINFCTKISSMFDLNFTASGDHVITVGGS
jgi:hypothetical protein